MRAAASPGGTWSPVSPCATASARPPWPETMSGRPAARASSTTRGAFSHQSDGTTTQSTEAMRAASELEPTSELLGWLPEAGLTGTLHNRFVSTPGAGLVRAKTGSTRHGVALSGYLLAASGRRVIFSVVVNEPYTTTGEAIDRFVTGLAELL